MSRLNAEGQYFSKYDVGTARGSEKCKRGSLEKTIENGKLKKKENRAEILSFEVLLKYFCLQFKYFM